jgi:hypothetical protein
MLTLGASGATAWAITSPEDTTVAAVKNTGSSFQLQDAAGNLFSVATAAPSPCQTYSQSLDTMKAWLSMSQSALLTGRTVRIYFNTCGNGVPYIAGLDLDK